MKLRIQSLGLQDYGKVWRAMRAFTETRGEDMVDELWLVEHPAVYTLGLNGDPGHILQPVSTPVVQTDRGGQVTYHGPGQLVVYTLFDLRRLNVGVRTLVGGLESAAVHALGQYGIAAEARRDAPGVYVSGAKIASLGLRIRRGCSYHGLSLNVDMDLAPFSAINPCGYRGLSVTQLADLGVSIKPLEAAVPVIDRIMQEFGYQGIQT
jgi:lipoyl(octanoyl) transferase